MTFTEYYTSLSPEEKKAFAVRLDSSLKYLSQLNTGFRKPGRDILQKIEKASEGKVSVYEMLNIEPITQ